MAIRCGTSGVLDEVAVADVSRFIAEFVEFARASLTGLIERVEESGRLEDSDLDELDAAIAAFKKNQFSPTEIDRPGEAEE